MRAKPVARCPAVGQGTEIISTEDQCSELTADKPSREAAQTRANLSKHVERALNGLPASRAAT